MITKLLSTAVKLYLRSQVSQVEDLQVRIDGKNRQILQGYIPQVFLRCKRSIYQGLHLREVEVKGNNIAVNLPEVLKKKPLRLLEPIIAEIKLCLDAEDLSASIDSELLQSGLTDLWQILRSDRVSTDLPLINSKIEWTNIAIADDKLNLSGVYQHDADQKEKLSLSAKVTLSNSHTLCLFPVTISKNSDVSHELAEKLELDLGQDVMIEELIVESKQLLCLGKITIRD